MNRVIENIISGFVVFQEISSVEGISHKTMGGMDYMTDGSVQRWEMIDGVKTIVEVWCD